MFFCPLDSDQHFNGQGMEWRENESRDRNSLIGFLCEMLVFCEKMSDLIDLLMVAHFW